MEYGRNEEGLAVCLICNTPMRQVTIQHYRTHNEDAEDLGEYKKMFPGAHTRSVKITTFDPPPELTLKEITKRKYTKKIISFDEKFDISDEEAPIQIEKISQGNDFQIEELQLHESDLFKDLSKKQADLKLTKEHELKEIDPHGITSKLKIELIFHLKKKFPQIKNNHIITVFQGGKFYRDFVTDIADVYRQIIFNFPKAFWHNVTIIDIPFQRKFLEGLGWKIYEIPEKNPTIENIGKYLDEL